MLAILTATNNPLQVSSVNSTPHVEVQSHDQINNSTMIEGSPVPTTQPQSGMGNHSVESCNYINTR